MGEHMKKNSLIGKPVIVRANVAGVHCGILESLDAKTQTAVLKNAYRLWRVCTRDKSGSVSDTAANGLKEPLNQHSIGAKLATVVIVNPQGLEVAEATDAAYASIGKASPS
jgi:hypothetical protein